MKPFDLGTRSFFPVTFSEKTLSYRSAEETGNSLRKKRKEKKKGQIEKTKTRYLN